jgi:hypothetical protein
MNGRNIPDMVGVEHVPSALLPSDPSLYWKLTVEEEKWISSLIETYKVSR